MSDFASVTPQQPQTLLYQGASSASPGTVIAIDPTTQALMFGMISNFPGIYSVLIFGNQSGLIYFSGTVTNGDFALCPVSGAADTSVTVQVTRHTGTPATITLTVIARQDPIISYLTGVQSGQETNRFQPVILSTGAGNFVPNASSGLQVVSGSATAATVALLAAPNAFQAYRIFRIILVMRAAATTTEAFGTLQTHTATAVPIAQIAGQGFASYVESLAIPLDIADGIDLVGNTAAVPVSCSIWYSLIGY